MLEALNNWDWEEAFAYASGRSRSGSSATPQWVPESTQSGSADPFDREDVGMTLDERIRLKLEAAGASES